MGDRNASVPNGRRAAMLALGLAAGLPTCAETVVATGLISVEPISENAIRLRKLFVPGQGFKYGAFVWDPIENAYRLSGTLKPDDNYFANIQLWRKYGTQASAQSEALDIFTGGIGVQSAQVRSPLGASLNCTLDGSELGVNRFLCGSGELAVGQTQFGNGRYIVTYTLTGGAVVTRSYYLSGGYPSSLVISFPAHASTNVPTAPTLRWTAIGAANYDIIIRTLSSGATVYSKGFLNSIGTGFTLAVPAGHLAPNTTYKLTIEALGANTNGGAKGFKRESVFTTAP